MDSAVHTPSCAALRREIEGCLRGAFAPADVIPRLARLAQLAQAAGAAGGAAAIEHAVFAHRHLAELLVEQDPWRAAIHARRALAGAPADDRAWAVLAFCQTLLGNYRSAAKAYQQAIASAPGNPSYAHNLGHLLDVAIGAPERALPWLRAAYAARPDNAEIVASFVHALARAGQPKEARRILGEASDRCESRELVALGRWLDRGAPDRQGKGALVTSGTSGMSRTSRPHGHVELAANDLPRSVPPAEAEGRAASKAARAPAALGDKQLARALERGLLRLPLDARQRDRALRLARDLVTPASARQPGARPVAAPSAGTTRGKPRRKAEDVAGLAAAVAYAIVYVDHVPLSQAEVAAPFRVGVGRLRGRFAELRARLDIIRGDARYASR